MAKDKERATAKQLFMKGETNKRIAEIVGVQEKTISNWSSKYGWKQQREAKLSSHKSQVENLRKLLGTLTSERLELQNEIERAKQSNDLELEGDLRKKANGMANEVAHYNKTLEQLDRENKIPLVVYIEVMDEIFHDLQRAHPKLYTKTIDFQENHLTKVSKKY